MNKCENCGNEFEGNFCPNCGQSRNNIASYGRKVSEKKGKRKVIPIILGIIAVVGAIGAIASNSSQKDASSTSNNISSNSSSSIHIHEYEEGVITKEASYTETGKKVYTCASCGNTKEETIAKLQTPWSIGYYVDDFGDPTEDSYIGASFRGTFSNSATNSSQLLVYVYFEDDGSVRFRLYEYGSIRATFLSSETVTLKIKTADEQTYTFTLSGSSDVYSGDQTIRTLLINEEKVSCVISTSSKYTKIPSTYRFDMDCLGLSEFLK